MSAAIRRLSMNQATLRTATLEEAVAATAEAGIPAIGTWRDPVNEIGLERAAKVIASSGLRVSTHCRGGFFTALNAQDRRDAHEDNLRAIDETATLAAAGATGSAPVLVLVSGGLAPGERDLSAARGRARNAIADLVPHALDAGVMLAIEPLHPMYVSDRCVVSTLGQALDIAGEFPAEAVGVTVDTFHIFWDPRVLDDIARAGAERRIATYQVCDWSTPLAEDALLSRHYPGDGIIDFAALTRAVEATGYRGDVEVEIFNQEIWDDAHTTVARRTAESFATAVSPFLAAASQ